MISDINLGSWGSGRAKKDVRGWRLTHDPARRAVVKLGLVLLECLLERWGLDLSRHGGGGEWAEV